MGSDVPVEGGHAVLVALCAEAAAAAEATPVRRRRRSRRMALQLGDGAFQAVPSHKDRGGGGGGGEVIVGAAVAAATSGRALAVAVRCGAAGVRLHSFVLCTSRGNAERLAAACVAVAAGGGDEPEGSNVELQRLRCELAEQRLQGLRAEAEHARVLKRCCATAREAAALRSELEVLRRECAAARSEKVDAAAVARQLQVQWAAQVVDQVRALVGVAGVAAAPSPDWRSTPMPQEEAEPSIVGAEPALHLSTMDGGLQLIEAQISPRPGQSLGFSIVGGADSPVPQLNQHCGVFVSELARAPPPNPSLRARARVSRVRRRQGGWRPHRGCCGWATGSSASTVSGCPTRHHMPTR